MCICVCEKERSILQNHRMPSSNLNFKITESKFLQIVNCRQYQANKQRVTKVSRDWRLIWLTYWLKYWLIYLLTDWLTNWVTRVSRDWLTDILTYWLKYWQVLLIIKNSFIFSPVKDAVNVGMIILNPHKTDHLGNFLYYIYCFFSEIYLERVADRIH